MLAHLRRAESTYLPSESRHYRSRRFSRIRILQPSCLLNRFWLSRRSPRELLNMANSTAFNATQGNNRLGVAARPPRRSEGVQRRLAPWDSRTSQGKSLQSIARPLEECGRTASRCTLCNVVPSGHPFPHRGICGGAPAPCGAYVHFGAVTKQGSSPARVLDSALVNEWHAVIAKPY